MAEIEYVGDELDLFAGVKAWKSYWSGWVRPYIIGDVLEVGAGIGTNTALLDQGPRGRWVCLEPDPQLAARMTAHIQQDASARVYESVCGTLSDLEPSERFDTIIYIDVLEHIEHDREELQAAANRLRPRGRIIVLSPAHQRLYTPFDKAIGHFRRYSRQMLRVISPSGARIEELVYLDSAGLLASATNAMFLKQSMPTREQLQIWDKWLVPVSRVMDKYLGHHVGKSVIAIWRKE